MYHAISGNISIASYGHQTKFHSVLVNTLCATVLTLLYRVCVYVHVHLYLYGRGMHACYEWYMHNFPHEKQKSDVYLPSRKNRNQ